MVKIVYTLAIVALLLATVATARIDIPENQHKSIVAQSTAPVGPKLDGDATPWDHEDDDDGPDTPKREASGGHGGCAEIETVLINGMITPKCVNREYTNDDKFWLLHPWLA